MNLKQFLKPDWRKIILTVLISIISVLIFFGTWIEIMTLYPDGGYSGPSILGYIAIPTFLIFESYLKFFGSYTFIGNYISIIWLIVSIIYWYLLSCLIVWIYDKFRKKK